MHDLLTRAEEKYKAEKQPQMETLASFFVSGCKGNEVAGSHLQRVTTQNPKASMSWLLLLTALTRVRSYP